MRASLLFFLYAVCAIFVSGCEKQVRLSNGRIIYQPINGPHTSNTQPIIIQQPIIQQQEQKPMMQPVSNANTAFGQEGVISVKDVNNQYSPNTSHVNTNAFVSSNNQDINDVSLPSSGRTQDNIDYNGSLLQQAIMASRNQATANDEKDIDRKQESNEKPLVSQNASNNKPSLEDKKNDTLKTGLYLQLGAFNDRDGAVFIQKKALSVGIKSKIAFMGKQHHVLVGPYKNKAEGSKIIDILDGIDIPYFWKEV